MASTVTIDLRHVARGLDFPLRQVQAVVELLDDGNTVPFITRYRKDQTGGLDEEQIREIQDRLTKMRLLADRKQTILRSIESQGKLTEKLEKQILSAATTKRLEDLYLPYKPKKQTLATLARSRGLEELANEILEAAPTAIDLDARARDFANPDRQVPSGADALLGAGHILAEQLSERADLRQRLREILQKSGKLVTTQVAPDPVSMPLEAPAGPTVSTPPAASEPPAAPADNLAAAETPPATESLDAPATASAFSSPVEPVASAPVEAAPAQAVEEPKSESAEQVSHSAEVPPVVASASSEPPEIAPLAAAVPPATVTVAAVADEAIAAPVENPAEVPDGGETPLVDAAEVVPAPAETPAPAEAPAPALEAKPAVAPAAARRARDREKAKAEKQQKKDAKRKKIEQRRIKAFRDYFNYTEDIKKIPPHRVLAINRAERAKVLRVRIDCDLNAMDAALTEILVPPGHPHADYLRGCARDALNRLILPALEREARRELTDRAESHAVGVFARNLRNLLLQPPVHNRRVLAVDPGFKSGCKLAALDQFGNVLGHDVIYLVGSKPGRKEEAQQKALHLIRSHELSVVAVGNGTACRETEDFFAELLGTELKDQGVAYVIVNEAGASVYSTSQLGREEFPEYDATLRGAVSIGRRLLDPLSELVKIDPANIGVGLYQHDVKAKHLEVSLDEVVESCVNYVGVDVNTASPALLRYVSGLNQLTARRVYEYRREHGPFRSREQLREVPGFGEATFVQAAGFLKIAGGENPLDATWIHPESYTVATQVLEKFNGKPSDLADKETAAALAVRMAAADLDGLAKDLADSLKPEVAPAEQVAATASPISAEPTATTVTVAAAEKPGAPLPAAPASSSETAGETGVEAASASDKSAIAASGEMQSVAPVAEVAPVVLDEPTAAVEPAPPSRFRDTTIGALTLRDILAQLARPGRDPREDLPPPVFKQGVLKLEDLVPGLELTGTVLNVVDFGCFVDIGMHDSGLVHVSRLADRFIRDPHEVVAVGDIVKVWVMEVDKERRRVSLTMVRPGSERQRRPSRGEGGQRSGQEHEQGQAEGQQGDRPPRGGQGRPGGRRDGRQGNQQGQEPGQQSGQSQAQEGRPQGQAGGRQGQRGGRPQGGRPQGNRPDQGRRPPRAGSPQPGGPQGDAGPGGKPREDRRGGYAGPPRKPRYQGAGPARGHEFKAPPKPLIPITDAMKKGKEPMRTFGDLMQFFGGTGEQKPPVRPPSEQGKKHRDENALGEGQPANLPTATDGLAVEQAPPSSESAPATSDSARQPPSEAAATGAPLSPEPAPPAPAVHEPSPEPASPPPEGQA